VALTGAAAAAVPLLGAGTADAATRTAADYPPARTGIRGQQPGSYDVGHAVRDGDFAPGRVRDTGERYDLVVVGGGMSGLAAAYYFRQAHGRRARVLVLEALDDVGGHARRNEFTAPSGHGNRMMLCNGGTFDIDRPSTWTPVARRMLDDLGVDLGRLGKVADYSVYDKYGLGSGYFFDAEHWAGERLVVGGAKEAWADQVARFPMSARGRADLVRIYGTATDYYPGLSDAAKKDRLARISYRDYLRTLVGAGDEALAFCARATEDLWGVQIERVAAGDAWATGQPGFDGLKLAPTPYPGLGDTPRMHLEASDSDGFYYFPDGNASVARLLADRLVPGFLDGHETMTHVVSSRADYARLDVPGSPVRIRRNATAFDVRHVAESHPGRGVAVSYSSGGRSYRVHADNAVMACWNAVSSYIVRGLPAEQVDAMRYGVKVPLLYARAVLRDWRPFTRAKVSDISSPTMYWSGFGLNIPTKIGAYASPTRPDEPNVVTFYRTPNKPGQNLPCRDQHRAGRGELIKTSFADFEREIRDALARSLGAHGLDPARDITAITVNRWAHGYAYEYNSLDDPAIFKPADEQPYTLARRPHGRITIANSDAQAFAYTHAAWDAAHRAVSELP
jgi:spermidine dehydrogenase